MKKIVLAVMASIALLSVGGCIGKGKGKTPPVVTAPEPVVRKG